MSTQHSKYPYALVSTREDYEADSNDVELVAKELRRFRKMHLTPESLETAMLAAARTLEIVVKRRRDAQKRAKQAGTVREWREPGKN